MKLKFLPLIAVSQALVLLPSLHGQSDLVNQAYQMQTPVQLVLSGQQQNATLDEPLRVKVTLKNVSTELQVLSWPAEASFAFDFLIYDKFREMLAKRPGVDRLSDRTIREDLRGGREIRLYPGEEFSTTVDLNSWYGFTTDGRHLVQASFFDDRLHKKVWSNPLFVNLKPNPTIVKRLQVEEEIRLEEERTVMSPEGTVSFILQSMIERDWESAFKYLNWEKVVLLYEPFTQEWKASATSESKERIISDLQDFFKKSPEYANVVKFRIQNIVFPPDPDERVVSAYVRYSSRTLPSTFLNTYSLRRRGNKWYVWNIESQVTRSRDWETFDTSRSIRTP